jgi:hypothetical protein
MNVDMFEPDGSLNPDTIQSFDIDAMRRLYGGMTLLGRKVVDNFEEAYVELRFWLHGEYAPMADVDKQVEAVALFERLLAAKDRPGDGSRRNFFDGQLAYERKAMGTGTWTQLNGGPGGDPSYPLHLEPPTHAGLWLMDEVDEDEGEDAAEGDVT